MIISPFKKIINFDYDKFDTIKILIIAVYVFSLIFLTQVRDFFDNQIRCRQILFKNLYLKYFVFI